MIADIMDLRHAQPVVLSSSVSYFSQELRAIGETLERLCASLSMGFFHGSGFDGTDEQTLLWHCIAARENADYAERLRAAGFANKLRDGSSVLEITRYVAGLLLPTEAELQALYGPANGHIARARRRLFRPVDLALRGLRHWARSR
jgi:hypothetical protein